MLEARCWGTGTSTLSKLMPFGLSGVPGEMHLAIQTVIKTAFKEEYFGSRLMNYYLASLCHSLLLVDTLFDKLYEPDLGICQIIGRPIVGIMVSRREKTSHSIITSLSLFPDDAGGKLVILLFLLSCYKRNNKKKIY